MEAFDNLRESGVGPGDSCLEMSLNGVLVLVETVGGLLNTKG